MAQADAAVFAGNDNPVKDVMVGGRRCPLAGRVSMDLLAVDVTALASPDLVVTGVRVDVLVTRERGDGGGAGP